MARLDVVLQRYVAAVSVLGAGGAALAIVLAPSRAGLSLAALVLATITVLAESLPIKVQRRGFTEEITSSSTFAFALLLAHGLPLALVAQLAASALADRRQRKAFNRIAFNVGQSALTLLAAGAVLAIAGVPHAGPGLPFEPTDLPVMVLAAVAMFTVNNVLVSVVSALAQGIPIVGHIRYDTPWQAGLALLLLGMAPVVVVACDFSLLLLPLLVLPMIAVHRAGLAAVRDRHRALHDELTGLPNRSHFGTRAELALQIAGSEGGAVAFAVLDLDRFKEVNDTLGHPQGDELLRLVGLRLRDVVADHETVARLGGDEFGLVLPLGSADEVPAVAARLLEAFAEPFDLGELELGVEASIGLALWPEHGADADTLLRHADVALYQAKGSPLDVAVYEVDQDPSSLDRLALLGELRQGIARGELRLVFMPKVGLEAGSVLGVEALVRWEHPTRGTLSPSAFVPHAERTGLIGALTLAVLELAIAQGAAWSRAGAPTRVAVNLSARNLLDRALPDAVAGLLVDHELPAALLELEITESMIMSDPDRALVVLEELAGMGVHLTIDDFGTGYSSLAYLKQLPVSTLKIDRSFVTGMLQDEQDAHIVQSIVDLARNLRLQVVAEGVEDEATRDALAELGCDAAQGYLFGAPAPADALGPWRAAGVA